LPSGGSKKEEVIYRINGKRHSAPSDCTLITYWIWPKASVKKLYKVILSFSNRAWKKPFDRELG
jgi:hypothetical protein